MNEKEQISIFNNDQEKANFMRQKLQKIIHEEDPYPKLDSPKKVTKLAFPESCNVVEDFEYPSLD